MSEVLPKSHEQHHEPSPELQEHHRKTAETAAEKGRNARHEHAEKIHSIRHEAKHEAHITKEHVSSKVEEITKSAEQPMFINRELKGMAYKRTLTRTQKSLPAPARAFSKVIHAPGVEAVSEVMGKTVARPSGVLSGGFFAFLGSSIFLYIAKHYGYTYNFLLFALLFIAGFGLGLLVELAIRLIRRR